MVVRMYLDFLDFDDVTRDTVIALLQKQDKKYIALLDAKNHPSYEVRDKAMYTLTLNGPSAYPAFAKLEIKQSDSTLWGQKRDARSDISCER